MTDQIKKEQRAEKTKLSNLQHKVENYDLKLADIRSEIKKYDSKHRQFDQVFEQLTKLNDYVNDENMKVMERLQEVDRNQFVQAEVNRTKHTELKQELRAIYDLKKDLQAYNKKIEEYKAEMFRRIDQDTHLFSLQVAEIRKPQAYMQQLCDLNHKQIQEFSEKVSLRKSDLEVHEEKIGILTERINQLE